MRVLVDLYCGRGGWTKGFQAVGWRCFGFDIVNHGYPGELVLQDVRTISGARLRGSTLIVASPPCTEFAKFDKPCWFSDLPLPDMSLVAAAYRIAIEARVPLLLENVRGAIRFLGRDYWRAGSFYLWGWRPLLLPNQIAPPPRKNTDKIKSPAVRAEIPFALAHGVALRANVELATAGEPS